VKKKNESDKLEMVVLKTSSNNYEIDLIKSLLEENEIPYILKERGIGGYMKIISGSSLFGTDILVEKSSLEKAKTLMDELDLNQ
jgi:hypothetical protein